MTQSLLSDSSLRVLHDWVTERQGGDSSFTFIVPGPPGEFFLFLPNTGASTWARCVQPIWLFADK